VDLAVLAPDELVAVYDLVGEVEYDRGGLPGNSPEVEQQIALHGAIERTLEGLPERNLDFGREVYTALSESPDHINRGMVGVWMDSPCPRRPRLRRRIVEPTAQG